MSTRSNLKFSRVFSKHRHPGKLHCTFFFIRKDSTVIYVEGGKALS